MLWSELVSLLGSSPIVILQENASTAEYYAAELLNDQTPALTDGVVYFAPLSQFSRLLDEGKVSGRRLGVVLYCDQPLPAQIPPELENAAGVRALEDYFAAFSLLTASFQQAFQLNNSLQDFLGVVAGGAGMDEIAQRISAVYHQSVGIYDTCFTVIGRSAPEGFQRYQSEDLLQDMANGYVGPDLIRQVQSEQDRTYFTGVSSAPILVHHRRREFKHYSTPILIGTTTAGFFSVFLRPEEDLTPVARLYLTKFAKLISVTIQRNDFYNANKAHFYTYFFASMLSDQGDYAKDWESRIKAYGYDLKPSMHMVVARFTDSVSSHSRLNQLVSALHHLFPGSIYCVQYDLIILFCSNEPGRFSALRAMEQQNTFFVRSGLKLGVSSEFHSLYAMRSYFDEAVAAIDVGTIFLPNDQFYFYDDLRVYHMIYQLSEKTDTAPFCYPPFMALLDYDRRKHSDLAQTVYYYLSGTRDPAAVCEKLRIHKNTLYFRLDKAKGLMGVDLDKLSVRSQIFLTVIILRLAGKVNWDYYEPLQQLPLDLTQADGASSGKERGRR